MITENINWDKNGNVSPNMFFDNLYWMDSRDAADYLRITTNAIRVMVCRGKLKAYKLGRRLRFRKDDLESLFLPQTQEAGI